MSAPTIIVGAGPVGLTVALALARANAEVVVLERRPKAAVDARATTVQPPVLEILDALGVLEGLLAEGQRVDRLQYWDLSQEALLAELDFGELADRTRFPFRLHVPQARVVDALARALEDVAPRALRRGSEVVGFEDRGDRVVVRATRAGAPVVIEGSTLVAADGGRSGVRSDLGIAMDARDAPVAFVTARADLSLVDALQLRLGPVAPPVARAAYVFDEEGWAFIMAMKDHVRVLLPALGDDVTALSRDAMMAQSEAILGPGWGVEVESLALYHVTQRVAQSLRRGRVVLAGDAAHQAWPVGGTSMNFGMLDAWHLARALQEGSESALDGYAVSRRRAATEALLARADDQMRLVDPWGMWERHARARLLGAIANDPEEARRHARHISMLPVS